MNAMRPLRYPFYPNFLNPRAFATSQNVEYRPRDILCRRPQSQRIGKISSGSFAQRYVCPGAYRMTQLFQLLSSLYFSHIHNFGTDHPWQHDLWTIPSICYQAVLVASILPKCVENSFGHNKINGGILGLAHRHRHTHNPVRLRKSSL